MVDIQFVPVDDTQLMSIQSVVSVTEDQLYMVLPYGPESFDISSTDELVTVPESFDISFVTEEGLIEKLSMVTIDETDNVNAVRLFKLPELTPIQV